MPVSLASTLDGTYVAVLRAGTVTLHASDSAGEVAQASIGLELDGAIAFAARHVLVHVVDGKRSVLSALSLPKLAIVSQLELDAPTRLLAVTHGYALLDRGDAAFVAQCTTGALAIAPLRVTTGIDRAIGLEAPQFMTWSKRGPEIWDAPTRRPNARIALALPDGVREIGVAGHQRMLWMTLGGDEVRTVRLSDGRTVSVRLPARPEATVAHPMSSWIVTELGGVPHAVNLAVQTIEGLELPVGARAVVPDGASETGAWVVVADERGRIARVPIGGATAGAGAVVAVAEQVRAEVGRAAAAGGGGGAVAAVGGGGGAIVAAATPKAMTVSERLAQRSKGAAPGPASASAPATQPPSPTAVGANVDADDARGGAVGRGGSAVPAVVLVERRTLLRGDVEWRRRVVAWAREGHDGVPEAPPIEDLASRAGIGPAGASVLAALYADWLEGNGERGIAAAVAAEVAGDDGAAWREALGTGQLASLGMVVAELGRVRLLPSVGTWLDGRAPRCIEILAATRETGALVPPEGAHRVAAQVGESARACAERLASAIGGVALCELEGQGLKAARQWADQGRLEGWLRDLAVATPIDLGVITPRPGERVLAIAAAGTLESAGLPWWKVAR